MQSANANEVAREISNGMSEGRGWRRLAQSEALRPERAMNKRRRAELRSAPPAKLLPTF
jgi:hypothetical protein